MCRFISRLAVKEIFARQPLPAFTETWVVGTAEGRVPVLPIAGVISVLLAASGLYFALSGKPSAEARTSGLALVCSVGFTVAAITLGSTIMGLVLPFVKLAPEQ
jgi:hypothetical protein